MIGAAEQAAVAEVLRGPTLTQGPRVGQFEEHFARFTGADHAVAVSSCTAALHLAYDALGIGPGDEVVVPAQTHVASAHAIELTGATAVFVDVEPETGNIDIDALRDRINPRTRAVCVVHFLGLPADLPAVLDIARQHGLAVIEDCALALGATYDGVHVGLHGDAGCFSFYPVKHITTAEGGMLITRRPDLAKAVAQRRAFGIDRNITDHRFPSAMYDVTASGINARMTELGAAIGIAQLDRLPEFLQRRKRNHRILAEGVAGRPHARLLRSSDSVRESAYYCQCVVLEGPAQAHRRRVIEMLSERGIGTSIYYPKPVPHLTYYRRKYGVPGDAFPVASALSNASVALPVGPHLDDERMRYIAGALEDALTVVTST
jgi:dTDP-4-amino-4,6-dideoxygalactose transaminase